MSGMTITQCYAENAAFIMQPLSHSDLLHITWGI